MKESELRAHAKCDVCKQLIGHTGLPLFWAIKIERYGIDLNAMRRQDGLAALIGNTSIASAMGPDEDMAKLIDASELTLCEQCAMNDATPAAQMAELACIKCNANKET